MILTRCIASLALIAVLGCDDDEPPPPPSAPPEAPPAPSAEDAPTSNFGTLSLSAGFSPDPRIVSGTSGGQIPAAQWDSTCAGWVSPTPDHVLVAATSFERLYIVANAGAEDTTLVIEKPDGGYLCDDDSEGRHPIVEAPLTAGSYKIWIGSSGEGVRAPYALALSELDSFSPAQIAAPGEDPAAEITPSFGTIELAPGFPTDPFTTNGTAGGPIDASTWNPSCGGFVSARPDHVFVASGEFNFLKVLVHSDEDTTLVIQKSDGTYACNDDSGGLDPIVTGSFPAGAYRIWIGSYDASINPPYTLGFSEMSSTTSEGL